jgi:hypothetical protein
VTALEGRSRPGNLPPRQASASLRAALFVGDIVSIGDVGALPGRARRYSMPLAPR